MGSYGLPKIQKPDCPLQNIVSSINSYLTPLYELASFLHNIIYSSIPKTKSHISHSFHLVKNLTGKYIQDDYKLISLDVISLFTNVPTDLALDSIKE